MLPHVNKNEDDLDDSDLGYNIKETKKIKWQDKILLNRPLKVVICFILVAVIAPILIYHFLFFTSMDIPPSDGFSIGSCLIARESRLLCGYGNTTAEQCHSECCYDRSNGVCFHRFPSRFSYILDEEWTEEALLTSRISTVPYGSQESIKHIRLAIDEISTTHLSLTFYKSEDIIHGRRIEEKNYVYEVTGEELNVVVNATQGNIFNTARGPIIASNDIWEIGFKIANESMYGLGEIPLKENTVKVIYSHNEGLSSIPLIFAKSNSTYNGLLFDTIAPTEIHIGSENQIVVRSISNWGLKFHLFAGPEPADIMRDVMKWMGGHKKLEYWMLGAHVCSESTSSDPTAELRDFISTADTNSMPFESHCGTAPVVFNSSCNSDNIKLIEDGATALRLAGKKFVPHVSPYIQYFEPEMYETEEDTEEDTDDKNITKLNLSERCFDDEKYEKYILRDANSEQMYIGTVDDHDVIYPNYDNISKMFMQKLWVYGDFDGVVLENNWPLDESAKTHNDTRLLLPYFSKDFEMAFEHTPAWNATRPEKYLYTHNKYGNQVITAFQVIKEVPTLSTSQWMNINVTINRQGIETSWSSLQKELVEASLGGISGHWYWSSPICGDMDNFNNSTQIRLCAKWYMAGTYFPMIKIHSKNIRRDPFSFIGTDKAHMITALKRRVALMPYFFTILQEGPLLRPMFYQFPYTEELTDLTTQFSVGGDLLIVPNLQPSQSHVHIMMPPGQWYEFGSGLKIEGEVGQAVTMTTTEADFFSLIRGGSIIPKQEDIKLTTRETQLMSRFVLIIALHCEEINITEAETMKMDLNNAESDIETTTDASTTTADLPSTVDPTVNVCSAEGKLHMTSEMIISFAADAETLTITSTGEDFEIFCKSDEAIWNNEISDVNIYGLNADQNNYDNHRHLKANIKLCDLQTNEELNFTYI